MVNGGFRLDLLLITAQLARATYYYQLKQLAKEDKDKALKADIQTTLRNSICPLFWMAITAKLLILPYLAHPTSCRSSLCLRRPFLKQLTQIPSSIVTKAGNTSMKLTIVFLIESSIMKLATSPCLKIFVLLSFSKPVISFDNRLETVVK